MPRLPLIELEDQPWLPVALRDYATDCLRFLFGIFVDRTSLCDRLEEVLDCDGEDRIVDLCSGGAGPLLVLVDRLARRGRRPRVLLSDLFPNLEAFRRARLGSEQVDFLVEPLDARSVTPSLGGARTLFSALHHFDPVDARAILASAAAERRAIGVFEVAERRLGTFLSLLGLPLAVWAMTPWLRPLSLGRIIWTYIVPLVPLIVVWDGLASCLRSYSLEELRALTEGLDDQGYRWRIGRERVRGMPVTVTYVLGLPARPKDGCHR